MRGFRIAYLAAAAILAATLLAQLSFGQYWFQSGANAGSQAAYNNGAGAYIQTIAPQSPSSGALGFWVGETLQNGAFVQVGYEVPNVSGDYPKTCTASGCNGTVFLKAGYPAWFWEYFPIGGNSTGFYGGVGPSGSAGTNGTFNMYSFSSNGDTWNFYFNGQLIGSANLGTSTSGPYVPSAYAELANANNTDTFMKTVMFKNMSYMKNGALHLLQSATAYVGYGSGSKTNIANPYGVKEVGGYANYFEVGSAVQSVRSGALLWTSVYHLQLSSPFGNVIGAGYYPTFSAVNFSVQQPYVYITPSERAVFAGWQGAGPGSYTGASGSSTVQMVGNVTEIAKWNLEYYVNATSQFSNVSGSGWYAANSTAKISLSNSIVDTGEGTRELFSGWSNGSSSLNTSFTVLGPVNMSARWQEQYLISLNTSLGVASGAGWYDAGSSARISLNDDYFNSTNTTRVAFYSWNGIYYNSSTTITVNSPVSLAAVFRRQHLVRFSALDSEYDKINATYFVVDGMDVPSSTMLFDGVPYSITGAYYKGVLVTANITANISSSVTIPVKLPVYDVRISAKSLFKASLNASAYLTFQNGTSYTIYLGPTGSVTLQDVPFGNVSGYMRYDQLKEPFRAVAGNQVYLTFITPIDSVPIIIVIAVMLLYEIFHRRRYRRLQSQS